MVSSHHVLYIGIAVVHLTHILIHSQSLGPFCLDHGDNYWSNGEFVHNDGDTNDGKNYYTVNTTGQTNCEDYYLFWNSCSYKWYIYTSVSTGCRFKYTHKCAAISNADNPGTCTDWIVNAYNYGQVVTERSCGGPALCDSITLSSSVGGCSGTLDQIAPNQFGPSVDNGHYLIYARVYRSWICVDNIALNWGCQTIQPYWESADEYKYPFIAGDQQIYNGITFTCNGPPSDPTSSPSTPPTAAPSNQPSKTTSSPSETTNNPASTPTETPSNIPSDNPSPMSTNNPSEMITFKPSNNPTYISTTTSPYEVVITITFTYNISNTTKDINIYQILNNTITTLINNGINNNTIDCFEHTVNINVTEEANSTVLLTATIIVCYKKDANNLVSYFNSTLQNDFINNINSDHDIIATNVNTDVIGVQIRFDMDISSTIDTTDIVTTKKEETNNEVNENIDSLLLIAIIAGAISIVCLIGFILCCIVKRKTKQFHFDGEMQGNDLNMVPVMPIRKERGSTILFYEQDDKNNQMNITAGGENVLPDQITGGDPDVDAVNKVTDDGNNKSKNIDKIPQNATPGHIKVKDSDSDIYESDD